MRLIIKKKFDKFGINADFIQQNHSKSKQGTLRGLHFQSIPHAQAKLIRVLSGEIYDVAIDMRTSSVTLGRWVGVSLSSKNRKSLYIPKGFAHGFYVLSSVAEIEYMCTDIYMPKYEHSISYDDKDLDIKWPLLSNIKLSLSDKDSCALKFKDILESGLTIEL